MTRHSTVITAEKLHRLVPQVVVKYISEVMCVNPFGSPGRKPEWNNHLAKSNWRASHLSPPYAGTFPSLLLRYQPGPKHSFTTVKASLDSTTFMCSFLYASTEDKTRLSEASGLWRAQQSFCHGSTIPLDIQPQTQVHVRNLNVNSSQDVVKMKNGILIITLISY